ncbi:MAG: DUF262 domain-containing protein [Chloroflexota bacterium]
MEADSFRIAKVFSNGGDIQFRLPYFQREYAWKLENWQTLWEDILDLYAIYSDERPPEHFMGSLVVINEGTERGTIPVFKLVDGQQRLTTISLVLCALANLIKDTQPNLYHKIRKYVTNPDEHGDLHFKLLPTSKYGDRNAYLALLMGDQDETINSSQIPLSYQFYYSELAQRLQSGELNADRLFLVIINTLQVVFINLNNNERPYQIFESLNAKGKPLTQADLVRNYIAMKLPEARQPFVFENHWSKIENLLQEKRPVGRSRLGELTAFLRHYLAYRNGVLGNEEHVYARFRDRIETQFNTLALFEEEVITLKRFAGYYDRLLRPENEPDPDIQRLLKRLNILEFSTGYPFLLAMYEAYIQERLSQESFLEGLQILENYMVRRYLTGEPTNYLNKVFPTIWKDIDLTDFTASLKKVLIQRNYPGDYRIRQAVQTKRLYDNSAPTRSKTVLVLESINRHLSKRQNRGAYTVLDGSPTIEHIMPQTLDDQWREELGENFEQIYDQYLNTLGNLTLVTQGWNSDLSNAPFSEKKPKLAEHGLLLNKEYFKRDIIIWNDQSIKNRAEYLVEFILELWPALGELPAPKAVGGAKPINLTFLEQCIEVTSWRDVAEQTTETIIQLTDHFEDFVEAMPFYLSHSPFSRASRQLSNGIYMNVNLSAVSIKAYCQMLIARAGLSVKDWHVEEV